MDEASLRSKMQAVVDLVNKDIATIRTGRATPSLVQDLVLSVYGGTQQLKLVELASITSPDPQSLVIEPWDKSIIGEIRQGILAANIGMNPSIDGEIIRISMPPLTTEDREKYVKLLSTKLENGKVMIRQIRQDAMKDLRTSFEEKQVSEDEKFEGEKKIQEITDEYIDRINQTGENKKQDLQVL